MHKNVKITTDKMNPHETIMSTDLCGPCFLRYERTESHVLMFRTLFNLKCGKSERRALRAEVK